MLLHTSFPSAQHGRIDFFFPSLNLAPALRLHCDLVYFHITCRYFSFFLSFSLSHFFTPPDDIHNSLDNKSHVAFAQSCIGGNGGAIPFDITFCTYMHMVGNGSGADHPIAEIFITLSATNKSCVIHHYLCHMGIEGYFLIPG